MFGLEIGHVLMRFCFRLFHLCVYAIGMAPTCIKEGPRVFRGALRALVNRYSYRQATFRPLIKRCRFRVRPLSGRIRRFIRQDIVGSGLTIFP